MSKHAIIIRVTLYLCVLAAALAQAICSAKMPNGPIAVLLADVCELLRIQ